MFWIFLSPLWWIGFFGQAFRWWVACEIFSFAVLPICFFIFPAMKDRGWGFSKIFGILFVTWINWYLCTVLKFSFLSVFIAFLIALVVSGLCIGKVKSSLIAFIKKRWRMILLYEAIFLFAFLFFVNIRSYCPEAMFNPDYSGAEKLMNCNYLHALMRTEHFPPKDNWIWGNDLLTNKPFYINYYYFGHLMWATLAKFSIYEARYAFNLGLATIFALTFIGSFALGFNLTRRLRWGFLAAFMVAFFGNIDALQQTFERIGFWVGRQSAAQSAWKILMSHVREAFLSVDFWRTSRVVDNTVTEFPFFSAILGDLHPHHSSLPIVLLAIGASMSLIMRMPRRVSTPIESIKKTGWVLLFLAFVICGAFAANTWDAIVLGFFAAVLIFYMNMRWWGNTPKGVGMTIAMVAGLGLTSLLLGLLFKLYFISPIKNEIKIASFFPLKFEKLKLMIVPLKPEMRAKLSDYFVLFGLFLFPLIIYLWGLFRNYLKKFNPSMKTLWICVFAFMIVFSWNVWHFWLPGLAMAWLVATIALLMDKRWGRRTIYFLLLTTPIIFFTLFVDTFYFDDRMVGIHERYNTLFKIYYPLWEFLALGAVYAFARMFRIAWIGRRWHALCGLALFLLATLIVGMLYPIQSIGVRTLFFH
ncbi:MAG TPA: DUF2298 domain-containing protein, partial [Candidatus Sumerlaeia bacterium]|nr:DUF2298 domain-containing protein [Candidatus Sumerlaeia bacterium]